ncbi:hypothetical protein AgCh_013704 [Apium graveolens]
MEKKMKVKKGWIAVEVGSEEDNERPTKLVIPISYLYSPLFRQLLDRAHEVYGYHISGPLKLPCSVDEFIHLRWRIEKESNKNYRKNHHHHLSSSLVLEDSLRHTTAGNIGHVQMKIRCGHNQMRFDDDKNIGNFKMEAPEELICTTKTTYNQKLSSSIEVIPVSIGRRDDQRRQTSGDTRERGLEEGPERGRAHAPRESGATPTNHNRGWAGGHDRSWKGKGPQKRLIHDFDDAATETKQKKETSREKEDISQDHDEWGSQISKRSGQKPASSEARSTSVLDRVGKKLSEHDLRIKLENCKKEREEKELVDQRGSKREREATPPERHQHTLPMREERRRRKDNHEDESQVRAEGGGCRE